jgi:hypothetical protein
MRPATQTSAYRALGAVPECRLDRQFSGIAQSFSSATAVKAGNFQGKRPPERRGAPGVRMLGNVSLELST